MYRLYRLRFPNGKLYFGITSMAVRVRWSKHKNSSRHRSSAICNAINKYGAHSVEIKELVVGPRQYILDLEVAAISAFKTTDREFGYNISAGGTVSPMESPEAAAKVSASWTASRRAENSKRFKGSRLSADHRKKISASLMGHPGYGIGKPRSDEVREKISASKLGGSVSLETRKKISDSLKNRTRSHQEATP